MPWEGGCGHGKVDVAMGGCSHGKVGVVGGVTMQRWVWLWV